MLKYALKRIIETKKVFDYQDNLELPTFLVIVAADISNIKIKLPVQNTLSFHNYKNKFTIYAEHVKTCQTTFYLLYTE